MGRLDPDQFQGLTLLENNLYKAPVLFHPPARGDFLLVVHTEANRMRRFHIRELKALYTVGQIEPRMQPYNPGTRDFKRASKQRLACYALRLLETNQEVSFEQLL